MRCTPALLPKPIFIGYWLLVIGYWLLVIGYWLLVIVYWLLVTQETRATYYLLLITYYLRASAIAITNTKSTNLIEWWESF